jgi:hypothetical protein
MLFFLCENFSLHQAEAAGWTRAGDVRDGHCFSPIQPLPEHSQRALRGGFSPRVRSRRGRTNWQVSQL